MNIQSISDNFVFGTLKFISYGSLNIINFDGKEYLFGDKNSNLKAHLKINKPGITFKIIKNGSIGLAEAYMRGDFETNNLSALIENSCNKKFHVSPFIEMECKYFFKILIPDNKLSVIINQSDDTGKLLYASQDGIKKKLNSKNLILSYITHPLMTFKIVGAIHYEALKLWLKGIKFVKKKLKIKNNISFEIK